jgi:hypothetical protein
MPRLPLIACFTFLSFAATERSSAQTANTACEWGLLAAIQVFEKECRPDDRGEYRLALDEAVAVLEKRTAELGTVPDFEPDRMRETAEEFFRQNPAQCQRGDVFEMAQLARIKGVALLRQIVSKNLAVPREKQTTECL